MSLVIGCRGFGCDDKLWETMCPKSFGGVRFVLRLLLQGRMWPLIPLMVYISLIIGRRDFGCEDNFKYRKSCAPNLLVGSDLTLDPSFKVECGT